MQNLDRTPVHELSSGSPAIDAGTTALTADQRGVVRPQPTAGSSDIGAFEVQRVAFQLADGADVAVAVDGERLRVTDTLSPPPGILLDVPLDVAGTYSIEGNNVSRSDRRCRSASI